MGYIGILPDFAFVVIIAVIVCAILIVVGVFCQINKRNTYDKQKLLEAARKQEKGVVNPGFNQV
jgi:hypothetical protein